MAPKKIAYREKGTLSGRTFLITRSSEGNISQRKDLESLGAKVIELSTIRILPPLSWKKLDDALSKLDGFDWVVFTSANGVSPFFKRLKQKYPKQLSRLRNTKNPKFACVGPATRRALEQFGFRSSMEPREFLTTSLGEELANSMNVRGNRILLARAQVANKELAKILRASGAKVVEAPTYRTVVQAEKVLPKILDTVTDITLTSPSTVKGLLKSLKAQQLKSRGISIHCIGPVTAKYAESKGLKITTVSDTHTMKGLVEAITKGSQRGLV